MLNLNLLPPIQRKNLDYEIDRRISDFLGLWLLMLGVIFGALLLPSHFFVILQQAEVERALKAEEAVQQSPGIREIEEEVKRINRELRVIVSREEIKPDVVSFFAEVYSFVPSGVLLELVSYEAKANRVELSGQASNRSAMLAFIDTLRKSPKVKKVSSPITNIIQEENITFSIELEVTP